MSKRGSDMKTNDRPITDLMNAVDSGAAQLPDFQRGLKILEIKQSKNKIAAFYT